MSKVAISFRPSVSTYDKIFAFSGCNVKNTKKLTYHPAVGFCLKVGKYDE